MPDHYPLSPSQSSRLIACPESYYECQGKQKPENEYMAYGTKGHLVAADAINNSGKIDCDDTELAEYLEIYVEWAYRRIAGAVGYGVEDPRESKYIPEFGGTIDFWTVHIDRQKQLTITVGDLKLGAGIVVRAENNSQLMAYLSLLREEFTEATQFIGTIIQPRTATPHIDSATFTAEQLDNFVTELSAVPLLGGYNVGHHCRWCPALTTCKAVSNEALRVAQEEFPDLPTETDYAQWEELMRVAPAIRALLDRIPAAMLEAMREGHTFEHFKAVRSRGNRTWKDDDAAVLRFLARNKIGKRLATEAKLKSPTQLTKEGYGDVIAPMVTRPERQPRVVTVDTKGEDIEFSPEFDKLES